MRIEKNRASNCLYDPISGRWLSKDPIGISGGLNQYVAFGNNTVNFVDPDGLLGSAVLDTKNNTLTVTDVDTKQSITVQAFTGGHSSPDGTIVSPGTGLQIPAPGGVYWITDNPNPKPGHMDWYGLLRNDDRIDDYSEDCKGKTRSGIRLHSGQLSHGCATVNKHQPNGAQQWQLLRNLITTTKTEQIDFKAGPHWWNKTKKLTNYGTLTIK